MVAWRERLKKCKGLLLIGWVLRGEMEEKHESGCSVTEQTVLSASEVLEASGVSDSDSSDSVMDS